MNRVLFFLNSVRRALLPLQRARLIPGSAKRSLLLPAVLCLCWLILAAGCGNSTGNRPAAEHAAYTVTDATGTVLHLPGPPQRIVSTSISTDEILLALVPASRVAAVTYLADDPGISNVTELAKPVAGRVRTVTPEALLALNPDLIVAADYGKPEMIKPFREMGIPLYIYHTAVNIREVEDTVRALGTVVQEREKAERLIQSMEQRLQTVQRQVGPLPESKRKRIAYYGSGGFYYMPKSSFQDICRKAGGIDVTEGLVYDKPGVLPQEVLVHLNPDVFMVPAWNYDGNHDPDMMARELLANPAYKETKAVRDKAVVKIPAAHVLSLSQYIVDAVEDLARALYPDRFGKGGTA